ncbi:SK1 [Scenedesmus sp. PABB004]|nr:SK1 [Scenedesmus sp. PABB004]
MASSFATRQQLARPCSSSTAAPRPRAAVAAPAAALRAVPRPARRAAQPPQSPLQPQRPPAAALLRRGARAQRPPAPRAAPEPAAPPPAGGAGGEAEGLDPSIPAVDQDFDLLGAEVKRLQEVLGDALKGCSIYLIGMMGSGKSTTGKMLANTLKYAFFDTDNVIELAHPGESVADIFKKYGEDYFRNCESQVLKELAPYKNLVVATGGGAVTRPKNWSYMHNGIVAWLQGDPDLLARRVVAEGIEKRPLLFGEGVSEDEAYGISLSKLQSLLAERTKYYENADVTVDLRGYGKDEGSGAPSAVVMHRLMSAVHAKIEATEAEREARRQFTIERAGDVPSMRKQPAPNAPAAEDAADSASSVERQGSAAQGLPDAASAKDAPAALPDSASAKDAAAAAAPQAAQPAPPQPAQPRWLVCVADNLHYTTFLPIVIINLLQDVALAIGAVCCCGVALTTLLASWLLRRRGLVKTWPKKYDLFNLQLYATIIPLALLVSAWMHTWINVYVNASNACFMWATVLLPCCQPFVHDYVLDRLPPRAADHPLALRMSTVLSCVWAAALSVMAAAAVVPGATRTPPGVVNATVIVCSYVLGFGPLLVATVAQAFIKRSYAKRLRAALAPPPAAAPPACDARRRRGAAAAMAASLLRAGGAFSVASTRMGAMPRARPAVAVAPRLNSIAPCVVPSCSYLGGSFGSSLFRPSPARGRGALLVVANAKKSLGCTKQGTRRARRRTSGFRTRMASPTGRKLLKLRRKKGRKNLCPASERSSAGKKQ